MFSRNLFILFVIIQWLMFKIMICQEFCNSDNKIVDSAMTFEDNIYLFRDESYWIFDPKLKSEPKFVDKINNTFVCNVIITKLSSIDAIFWRDIDDQNEHKLIFVNFDDKYCFFVFMPCREGQGSKSYRCIIRAQPSDQKYVPKNMSFAGGLLSDWFPKPINEMVILDDKLLIFHERSARLVRLTNTMNDTWAQIPKIELPFNGSLNSIDRIDAIFEIPSTGDLVIIADQSYCQLKKSRLVMISGNDMILFTDCKWKDWHQFFNCKPSTSVTTPENIESKQTKQTKQTNQTNQTNTTDPLLTEREPNKDLTLIIVMAVLVVVLFFIILGSILWIIFLCTKSVSPTEQKKTDTLTVSEPIESVATVATVDSKTGKILTSKSNKS